MCIGRLYITPGSITRISSDVIIFSTDRNISGNGEMQASFENDIQGFKDELNKLKTSLGGKLANSGAAFWLDCRNKRLQGVVVAVATGRGLDLAEKAFNVTKNSLSLAFSNIKERSQEFPLLIALPFFLSGRGGGHRDLPTIAEAQIKAAHEFVRINDADVVIVAYTVGDYHELIAARKKLKQEELRDGSPKAQADGIPLSLLNSLKSKECAIFIGSGMSVGSSLPGWNKIIKSLSAVLGLNALDEKTDIDHFLDLAQWYREAGKDPSIEEMIKQNFSVVKSGALPTVAHYLLGALPSRFYLTTNYDNLVEYALDALRKYPFRVVSNDDAAQTGGFDGSYIIKLHGCVDHEKEIVLSRDDYEDFLYSRPALALLLESLLLNHSFLFLGYSLKDPDFRSINHRIAGILKGAKRPAFSLTFDAINEFQETQWRKKQIELMEIKGKNSIEKTRTMFSFLDVLLEEVCEDDIRLLNKKCRDATRNDTNAGRNELVTLWNKLSNLGAEMLDYAGLIETASRTEILAYSAALRLFADLGLNIDDRGKFSEIFLKLEDSDFLNNADRYNLLQAALKYCRDVKSAEMIKKKIRSIDFFNPNDSTKP